MNNQKPSTLSRLRSLLPERQLSSTDAKVIAERQASVLIECLNAHEGITEEQIRGLPRIRIERDQLPTSGLSYWSGIDWVIVLNEDESPERQRFSLLHEYKHIIDHGHQRVLYRTESDAERIADYFAACALMPKRQLKRVFCTLTQDLGQIAAYFHVSSYADIGIAAVMPTVALCRFSAGWLGWGGLADTIWGEGHGGQGGGECVGA